MWERAMCPPFCVFVDEVIFPPVRRDAACRVLFHYFQKTDAASNVPTIVIWMETRTKIKWAKCERSRSRAGIWPAPTGHVFANTTLC